MTSAEKNNVSYAFFDRVSAASLPLNQRAMRSVHWALTFVTGERRAYVQWSIGDVARLTRHQVACIPGCGAKTVAHIEQRLAELGLALAEERQ